MFFYYFTLLDLKIFQYFGDICEKFHKKKPVILHLIILVHIFMKCFKHKLLTSQRRVMALLRSTRYLPQCTYCIVLAIESDLSLTNFIREIIFVSVGFKELLALRFVNWLRKKFLQFLSVDLVMLVFDWEIRRASQNLKKSK